MPRFWIAATLALFCAPAAAQTAGRDLNPRAIELFERDWALMHWARKLFDADSNGILSLAEANRAALQFREIADGDGDGRVTPYEYDRAREYVIARY